MIDFLTIVLLIFGVLQIILFFKIWGMTNDVKTSISKMRTKNEKRKWFITLYPRSAEERN